MLAVADAAVLACTLVTRGVVKQLGCEPGLVAEVARNVVEGKLSVEIVARYQARHQRRWPHGPRLWLEELHMSR